MTDRLEEALEEALGEWRALADEARAAATTPGGPQPNQELDPELEAVRLAILIEDVTGVTLTDSQIRLGVLADPVALRRLLDGHGRSR